MFLGIYILCIWVFGRDSKHPQGSYYHSGGFGLSAGLKYDLSCMVSCHDLGAQHPTHKGPMFLKGSLPLRNHVDPTTKPWTPNSINWGGLGRPCTKNPAVLRSALGPLILGSCRLAAHMKLRGSKAKGRNLCDLFVDLSCIQSRYHGPLVWAPTSESS